MARLAAGVTAAPCFPFPSIRLHSVFALATITRAPHLEAWQQVSASSHTSLSAWGTPSPTPPAPHLQPLHLHSLLPWHEQGPHWQAACHQTQPIPLHPPISHRFSCNHFGTRTWHHGIMFYGCSVRVV